MNNKKKGWYRPAVTWPQRKIWHSSSCVQDITIILEYTWAGLDIIYYWFNYLLGREDKLFDIATSLNCKRACSIIIVVMNWFEISTRYVSIFSSQLEFFKTHTSPKCVFNQTCHSAAMNEHTHTPSRLTRDHQTLVHAAIRLWLKWQICPGNYLYLSETQ
jgi:hypothetical protein